MAELSPAELCRAGFCSGRYGLSDLGEGFEVCGEVGVDDGVIDTISGVFEDDIFPRIHLFSAIG